MVVGQIPMEQLLKNVKEVKKTMPLPPPQENYKFCSFCGKPLRLIKESIDGKEVFVVAP